MLYDDLAICISSLCLSPVSLPPTTHNWVRLPGGKVITFLYPVMLITLESDFPPAFTEDILARGEMSLYTNQWHVLILRWSGLGGVLGAVGRCGDVHRAVT